jgi:hypothetical protein
MRSVGRSVAYCVMSSYGRRIASVLVFTYGWMYERRLIGSRERDLRRLALMVIERHEHGLAARIRREVEPLVLTEWGADADPQVNVNSRSTSTVYISARRRLSCGTDCKEA